MNALLNCLVLLGVPATLLVAGYGLAARLTGATPAERLAVSALTGLGLFIWNVSLLGLFRPISGAWTWACLWPLAFTVLDPRARAGLFRDFTAIALNRRGAVATLAAGLFLTFLLWPLLSRPGLVFYDGTSNHDAFFWISGAEFLREHTYMVEPVKSAVQPFTNGVGVFSGGWAPMWGRMSSEGLLALLAALVGRPPLQLYVAATAALFVPWIAAAYLVARTFLIGRPATITLVALCAAQPLFIFFHANANLPNLLGSLAGAVVVTATARSRRAGPDRAGWLIVLALGLHGLLCSYPEMVPFILLPAGLLWWRDGFSPGQPAGWRPAWAPVLAGLAGLALNPVTSIRACSGFFRSFNAARTDEIWPNLFRTLTPADYAPALATMTMHTSDDLGVAVAGLCSLLLVAALAGGFWRAHDRFGALAMMAGSGLLLVYTAATHFGYGWQKTAQFGGLFTAALLPVAAVEFLARPASAGPRRILARVALAGLGVFFFYATARNYFESHKWSRRKAITQDWFAVRDYAREHLRNLPVLVDAPSFPLAYFHGMWAIYFLADSHPLFPDRGRENGGYLRDYTRVESQAPSESPQAYLVSTRWAASFDANSPRLVAGDSVVLLARANRVDTVRGFFPKTGVPESAATHFALDLRPHSASQLNLDLALPPGVEAGTIRWSVTREVDQEPGFSAEVSGPPPWRFAVPLVPRRTNRIEFRAAGPAAGPAFPFTVTRLQVQSVP